MSLNQFYKYMRLALIGIFIPAGVIEGKMIPPVETDKKEILTINDKRRSYFQLHGNSLTWKITGPKRIEIIARRAVPRRDNQEKTFGYRITLDTLSTEIVEHTAIRSKGVTSSQHPGHGYTKSGHYSVKIPAGDHVIDVRPVRDRSKPVLVRMIEKKIITSNDSGEYIQAGSTTHHLKIGNTRVRYSPLSYGDTFSINPTGYSQIKIYSRLAFQHWRNGEDTYRLRIFQGNRIIGTYYFSSERSELSEVEEDKTIIPAKWRSCDIQTPEKKTPYSIELLDEEKTVYVRCIGFRNENEDH